MIIGPKKSKSVQEFYFRRSLETIKYAYSLIKNSEIAPYVNKLFVYGSCVKKEQRYDSDVDLFLELKDLSVIKQYRDLLIQLRTLVNPIDLDLPSVDLKIVIGDSWQHSDNIYFKNIRREGVNIWKA